MYCSIVFPTLTMALLFHSERCGVGKPIILEAVVVVCMALFVTELVVEAEKYLSYFNFFTVVLKYEYICMSQLK